MDTNTKVTIRVVKEMLVYQLEIQIVMETILGAKLG